jgi:hypothetical protein
MKKEIEIMRRGARITNEAMPVIGKGQMEIPDKSENVE